MAWFKVIGLHDVELIKRVGRAFDLHPLVMEDIVNTQQRPKLENFDEYLFLVLKIPRLEDGELRLDQISIVSGQGYVLVFAEDEERPLDMVADRLRRGRGRIRRAGADYLTYAVVDAVVDNFFTVLVDMEAEVEALEEALLQDNPDKNISEKILTLRRKAQVVRKVAWSTREVADELYGNDSEMMQAETLPYVRDVYDHSIQVIEATDSIRDALASLRDMYQNSLANRMNEVMKVLTIIATLFIPLTFLAGLYGMNFKHMPELGFWWAYPALIVLMIGLALVMLGFFRRRKWI